MRNTYLILSSRDHKDHAVTRERPVRLEREARRDTVDSPVCKVSLDLQ